MFDLYQIIPGLRDAVDDAMGSRSWETVSSYDRYVSSVEAAYCSEEEEYADVHNYHRGQGGEDNQETS